MVDEVIKKIKVEMKNMRRVNDSNSLQIPKGGLRNSGKWNDKLESLKYELWTISIKV